MATERNIELTARELSSTPDVVEESKPRSLWALNSLRTTRKKKKKNMPPASIYIILTSWRGSRVAVRYTTGRGIPMEKHPDGGSFLYFPQGMIYVRETAGEINAQIHDRLRRLQEAWRPSEDEGRAAEA